MLNLVTDFLKMYRCQQQCFQAKSGQKCFISKWWDFCTYWKQNISLYLVNLVLPWGSKGTRHAIHRLECLLCQCFHTTKVFAMKCVINEKKMIFHLNKSIYSKRYRMHFGAFQVLSSEMQSNDSLDILYWVIL